VVDRALAGQAEPVPVLPPANIEPIHSTLDAALAALQRELKLDWRRQWVLEHCQATPLASSFHADHPPAFYMVHGADSATLRKLPGKSSLHLSGPLGCLAKAQRRRFDCVEAIDLFTEPTSPLAWRRRLRLLTELVRRRGLLILQRRVDVPHSVAWAQLRRLLESEGFVPELRLPLPSAELTAAVRMR
jgi:hypothetical protein